MLFQVEPQYTVEVVMRGASRLARRASGRPDRIRWRQQRHK